MVVVRLAFNALLQVNLGVSILLIGSGEFASALVASERFLARVRPDVRREVIGSRESAHADAALERLLSRVDANVSREFV